MNELAAETRGIHVLVIDDDQFARHSLRSVLEFSGALVTAARADDAIRAALIADVIVCDLNSAEAAARRVPGATSPHARSPGTPCAGHRPRRARRERCVRAPGFEHYLAKPVDGG